MGFLRFLTAHVAAAVIGSFGVLAAVIGYWQEAAQLWQDGIKAWQLQAGGFALFVIAVLIILYRWHKEHVAPGPTAQLPQSDQSKLTRIFGAHFKNETVDLDGCQFVNCVFENVTLRYNGMNFELENCIISPSSAVSSNTLSLSRLISLIATLTLADKAPADSRDQTRHFATVVIPENHPSLVRMDSLNPTARPAPQSPQGTGSKKQP
jgi:Na+/melibiose symporter-like transporter